MFPKRFLFHFCFSCFRAKELWKGNAAPLDERFRLASTEELEQGEIEGKVIKPVTPTVSGQVDFRVGWNEKGLAIALIVSGKSSPPWSRQSQPEESDGLHLCIDTRDVRNVHRATRFCHRLILLPGGTGGSGGNTEKPSAVWVPIHRAKNHPNPVAVGRIQVRATFFEGGYRLDAMIPSDVLTGFEPDEHSRLGFHYVLIDREIGPRYLSVGPPFPHDQDPSLWPTLELVGS